MSSTTERFVVTGAMGCIGAWVVRNLLRAGYPVAALDSILDTRRLALILTDEELARIELIQCDITDLAALEHAMRSFETTHVIHLAGLQIPACRANPSLGASVNVVGTVNVFEAAHRLHLARVVYASSIAVYGQSEEYDDVVAPDAPMHPRTHYGVFKQANEGTARIYWLDHGVSSVGLRPFVVFGAGRDQGITSAPTAAMLAASRGDAFSIPFGGRVSYQYVDDAARIFIQAAHALHVGTQTFNLSGHVISMQDMIDAIETACPEARGLIHFEEQRLPFPAQYDDAPLRELLGAIPFTPLGDAVRETVNIFREGLAAGKLSR